MNKEQPELTSPADVGAYLYMRLLKRCLTRDLFPDQRFEFGSSANRLPYSKEFRQNGKDWPTEADTMVGMKRLENLHDCCSAAVRESVAGDFVETGIWRGGCGILMRAILDVLKDRQRKVWLFDSFEGLPKPDPGAERGSLSPPCCGLDGS